MTLLALLDPRRNGRGSLLALSLCALTHSFLLFSVYPYLGYMAVSLLQTDPSSSLGSPPQKVVTVDSAGLYAGLLGTAFTLGRTCGFGPWKAARFRLGLRSALLTSLALLAVFSVAFGLCRTFVSALVVRFLLGLSNGISGAVKRAAMDRSRAKAKAADAGEEEEEEAEWSQADILALMSWGYLIGPMLGGLLSDPVGQYSDPADSGSGSGGFWAGAPLWAERYPYLLPNLVGGALCLLSAAAVLAFIDRDAAAPADTPSSKSAGNGTAAAHDGPNSSPVDGEEKPLLPKQNGSAPSRTTAMEALRLAWKGWSTRSHLLAYWSVSFVVVTIDEALPLFLIARSASLGLSESSVGWVLCGAGLFLALSQHLAFNTLFDDFGLYRSLRLSSVLGTVPSALVPVALVLNGGTYADHHHLGAAAEYALDDAPPDDTDYGSINAPSYLFLVVLLATLRIYATVYFALIGVAGGRTVPPEHGDEVSRIMTLGALCVRSVAPTVAGALVSFALSPGTGPWWEPRYGSVALWCTIGLVLGSVAVALTFALTDSANAGVVGRIFVASPPARDGDEEMKRGSIEERRALYLSERQRAQMYVKLWEIHYDKGSNSVGAKWRRIARKAIIVNRFADGGGHLATIGENGATSEEAKEKRRVSWADYSLRPGVDPDDVPFFILGTHKHDKSCMPHVLTPPLMASLHQELPMVLSANNFWLKYSLVRDGSSIEALWDKIRFQKNTVLAVESLEGDVFGYFTTKPWDRTNRYIGCGESFLWRMKAKRSISPAGSVGEHAEVEGDIDVFRWTGENDLCQLLGEDKIAVGGGLVGGGDGFGFVIEDNLLTGSSSPSITFGNPCMVAESEGGRFEVANMEIWAMTPFLFVADAERSEQTMKFTEDNMNAQWSNFL